jgi:DNA-binding PadR family transcriptional regulator
MFNRFGFIGPRWGAFSEGRAHNFEKGALKYVILDLLKDKSAHGYEIIRALGERSHGMYSPSPGSVYPTLQLLSDMGYLTATEIDAKKVYTITNPGRKFLKENHESLEHINTFLEQRWPSDNKYTEWQQTIQSMHRLGQKLRGNFHELDKEQLTAIRGILDKSVHDIENIIGHPKKSEPPGSKK